MGYTGKKALGMKLATLKPLMPCGKSWNTERNLSAILTSCLPSPPLTAPKLKGIVDANALHLSGVVQGKARSEIWTRFNRHFRIAEYSQLPTERMAEARDYPFRLYREGGGSLCLKSHLPNPNKAPIKKRRGRKCVNTPAPWASSPDYR